MKILILHLAVAALYLTGCTATHYYQGQSDRVAFYLKAPATQGVSFASSLDNFQIHSAEKVGPMRWKITISANTEFSYFYIVDGSVYLPECEFYEKDDFGSRNCIYIPE